jgi:hypothetical protein
MTMRSTRPAAAARVLALALCGAALCARADDACIDFKWDVSKERALFAGVPAALASGKDAKSAPLIVPNRLYKLTLAAQDQVAFSAPPAKQAAASSAFAGLAMLKIAAPGSYRIAVDAPVWIDVVAGANLVAAKDFEGQHSCAAPHKIVEFELVASQRFVLQFSNGAGDNVLLTVTPSPPRKF